MNGTFPAEYPRLLRLAGGAVWILVGFPVLTSFSQARASGSSALGFAAWVAAFLLFAVAYSITSREGRFERDRGGALLLLAAQSAAVLALVALPPCYGLEGALMVLVAIQLGGRLSPAAGVSWIVSQSALFFLGMSLHWSVHSGIMIAGAYFPFQLLAFWTAHLLAREGAARQGLARVNAELHATRDLLAESHRMSERLRIARDLHDVLGHHLTALALNLEVASHQVTGPARGQIEAARDRSRELLGQIRDAVRALRSGGDEIRLDAAIRRLAEGIPSPRIHVEFADNLAVPDPGSAQILLRCAQEIITNAVKHSRAENLWLSVVSSGGAIEIQARDDGQGSSSPGPGVGLTGMRERLEERGGRLSVRSEPGAGFEVVAVLPAG
ncbi:MAG: sensor histidine kinase [Acidobacteriota bacterium]